MMNIVSSNQAVNILDSPSNPVAEREAAARYLEKNPEPRAVPRLVRALQDDDFGVRWAASEALAQLGETALEAVLQTLIDPDKVGDPRLRESVYHMLHMGQKWPVSVKALMVSLKGPAPDLASLEEAAHVLQSLHNHAPAPSA
jgi:HEAT repeat protein